MLMSTGVANLRGFEHAAPVENVTEQLTI